VAHEIQSSGQRHFRRMPLGPPGRVKFEGHGKPPVREVFGYHPVLRTAHGTFTKGTSGSMHSRTKCDGAWDQYNTRPHSGLLPQVLQTGAHILAHGPDASSDEATLLTVRGTRHQGYVVEAAPSFVAARHTA
jgi:hypothetical protein